MQLLSLQSCRQSQEELRRKSYSGKSKLCVADRKLFAQSEEQSNRQTKLYRLHKQQMKLQARLQSKRNFLRNYNLVRKPLQTSRRRQARQDGGN